MLKYELIFEFILILRIVRHFNIIKIVTRLEVVLQNVKRPKSDRNSGNVRNSSDYGIRHPKFFDSVLFGSRVGHGLGRELSKLLIWILIQISVAQPEEPKLNCLLEPESKLRIAALAPFYLSKTLENHGFSRSFCKLLDKNLTLLG